MKFRIHPKLIMKSECPSWKNPLALLASLGATLLLLPLLADPVPPGRADALTNWQTALSSFKKTGAFLGQEQYAQAKAELSAGTTNLPTPYGNMATQFLARLESALKQASDPSDARRRQTLAQLCAELRAYPAAVRLSLPAGGDSAAAEARDEPAFAWRLFEAGDAPAALREYKRRLAEEQVDMWQSHYQEQIRLLEQRPANLTNVPFALQFVREHCLKGYEEKTDFFGALQELTRVLPFARNPKEGLMVHQFILKCLVGLDDTAGRDAWEEKLLKDFKGEREACAQVYLERGLRAMDKQNLPEAMPLFRKVCAEYPDTEAYGDAQFSVGVVLQLQEKYDEAVAEFSKLFPSKVNDYALNPDSSEDCKNYRFRAALRISGCYEAKKDLAQALQYAELGRDRYKFVSYCKTCMQDTKESLDKRIAQLKEAVARKTP
jgi:tetratricopeptide (TPR) repeat protein